MEMRPTRRFLRASALGFLEATVRRFRNRLWLRISLNFLLLMAFWGIEVRPGEAYTHVYDSLRGRLRVSQAALGEGKDAKKSTVQCNVGDKSPVFLCNLIPNVAETCHLELEFEEYDKVVFSVLGQRTVHLTGYYLGSSGNEGGDDSEQSYGEDIAETESDESGGLFESEDDEYESDFIDDDDIEMFPSHRKSSVVIEEIESDEKPANRDANRHRLKKKQEISDSGEDDVGSQRQLAVKSTRPVVLESEDEDGFPIFFAGPKNHTLKSTEENGKSDGKVSSEDRKRKIDTMMVDSCSQRNLHEPVDASVRSIDELGRNEVPKKKKKVKGMKPLESRKVSDGAGPLADEKLEKNDKVECGNLKNNKKENKQGELSGAVSDASAKRKEEGDNEDLPDKVDYSDEGIHDEVEPENLLADKKADNSSFKPLETTPETAGKQKNKKKKRRGDKLQDGDEVTTPGEGCHPTIDNLDASEEMNDIAVPDAPSQKETKKKKKKKKKNKNSESDSKNGEIKSEDKEGEQPQKTRAYPNGLVVEELSMGKPDGKRASPGAKVGIKYIGKLRNGKIFDSSVGKRPFKFRLGVGQVIKGWDVGINGMRVGDKRRLTIPPSMGYGNKNIGMIPANSWLVFDVELVDVQ